jgi:hypothetical protein
MRAIIQLEFEDERELREKTERVALLLLSQLDTSGRRHCEIEPGEHPIVDIATDLDGQNPAIVAHIEITA